MTRLTVHVRPNAKSTKVLRWESGVLHLSVSASPIDWRANEAVILLIAGTLDIPKSAVVLVRGEHARVKVLVIEGLDEATLLAKLTAFID